MRPDQVDRRPPAARIGFGLAAVGRPSYINLGRATDLPSHRTVAALRERTHALLTAAYSLGVRYFDVARSYGRGEEFLAGWLAANPQSDIRIGSKWGYTYTGNWRTDARVHEVKDHSVDTFLRHITETRQLLGQRLNLYQVHSVTPQSPALTDKKLHRLLAELAAQGVTVGISTSGAHQGEAIAAALEVTVDGDPLFRSVQATYNLLEPSAADALTRAHAAGRTVIVKEAMANGRLAGQVGPHLSQVSHELEASNDAVALAAVLHHPWVDVVLSGAATIDQLSSNMRGASLSLTAGQLSRLAELAEPAEMYWDHRAALPWN